MMDLVGCIRRCIGLTVLVVGTCAFVMCEAARASDEIEKLLHEAADLHAARRYEEAEPLAQRALALAERIYGTASPSADNALTYLGANYFARGRLFDAEGAWNRAVGVREKLHGAESLEVAFLLRNSLGPTYEAQRRAGDAEASYQRSLVILERRLGRDDDEVANTLSSLGAVYELQERIVEAESLYQRSVAIKRKKFGAAHREVGVALVRLALTQDALGRFAEGERNHRAALGIFENLPTTSKADIGATFLNIARSLQAQDRPDDALPFSRQAASLLQEAMGARHWVVAAARNTLAELLATKGELPEAEPLFRSSLAIFEEASGPFSAEVGEVLHGLAMLCGRSILCPHETEALFQRAVLVREKSLGANHPAVATTLLEFSDFHALTSPHRARELYQRAMKIPGKREATIVFATNRAINYSTLRYGQSDAKSLDFGHSIVRAARDQLTYRAVRAAGSVPLSNPALSAAQRFQIRSTQSGFGLAEGFNRIGRNAKDAIIFVHGYNTSFQDAVKRATQISFDLDFTGAMLLFSWPSAETLASYASDKRQAEAASAFLLQFLDAVAKEIPGSRLHVIGHSMGSLVVLGGLEQLADRSPSAAPANIGEIVLAHPDIDFERLERVARKVHGLGKNITVYTSGDDKALWVSRWFNFSWRAGGALRVVPHVDTIDISGLGTRLWDTNHGVYATNNVVFGDIGRLIRTSERPAERRTQQLKPVTGETGTHWRYQPGG